MARLVEDQPFADYLAEADVNASALRAGRKSMLHMAAAIEGQSKEPTAALRIGSALHCAVLEPMRFEAVATVAPDVDRRTKDGKATYAAWQAALSPNAMVLDADEFETVRQASSALLESKFPSRIGTGEAEVSIYWDETVTVDGEQVVIACKARLDWLGIANGRPIIADIKTTRDATPRAFARACATYGYVHQMAWYRRAVRALQHDDQFQHGRCDVLLGAVETDAPHAVGIYTLFEADLNCADAENMETLERWARCILTGEIAGPCDDVTALEMPDWTFQYQRQAKQLRQQVGDIIDGVDDFDATIPF